MASSGYSAISFTAGEQPTTAKWNLIGSNDASFNTGNGFNDGILVTRHFATNAVDAPNLTTGAITLGYAQITTAFSSASSSATQVTGLTATVTIPAGSRRIQITAYAQSIGTSAASVYGILGIWDGAVGTGTLLSQAVTFFTSATGENFMQAIAIVQPAAGSKTYNVSISNSASATMTVKAGTTFPAFIHVKAM